ncbi:protein kinase [Duganella sp. LX20W]|uniref:Protein kinase n=1 Tax=Rugamonas brunnea TaxID=2758569 RepID=A0A7W2ICD7_9BURK|nr:cache domain-containing protein [Rugamonas brunnea]MBA5638456.1 protein kinase [Rugamonas brunnea]
MDRSDDRPQPDDASGDAGGAAREAELARRVVALETVVTLERRLREVHAEAARSAQSQLAALEAQLGGGAAQPLRDEQVTRLASVEPGDDDATRIAPAASITPADDVTHVPHAAPVAPADDATRVATSAPADDATRVAASAPGAGSSMSLAATRSVTDAGVPSIAPSAPPRSVLPAAPPPARAAPGEELPLALSPGFQLFEYRIDAVLGQGGFGITYLATDVNLNAKVAIKEYLPGDYATRASDHSVSPRWAEDNDFYLSGLESFLVEARTLATFRHPNIVRVARFFEAHRTAYMVLEYERGKPLKQWWEKRKAMPEAQLLSLLHPLFDGLALVHESGYLHRDIKPDNIYVRKEDGSLVLLDFGAARQTAGGAQAAADVVTPGYAPPEQYEGGPQGPWTDIYALGATLYWMATGTKPPPAPERQHGVAHYVPAREAAAGRYSDAFLAAIDQALMLDPAQRPQTVADFAHGLFSAHAGSLGLQDALRVGELEAQRRLSKGMRRLGRAVWRPASWPLGVKLTLALVLAALLPMTITAYYNLRASVATVSASELRNLESLARSTAGRVAQLLGDSRHLAAYLSTDPVFIQYLRAPAAAGRDAVHARLVSVVKSNPDVHLMFLMNAKGDALVSSEPGVAGLNFKFREYFQQAMRGHPFMTGVIVGSTEGKPGVYYAYPVFDARHAVIGVVVLRIKGSTIATILDQVRAKSSRQPLMIDGDGVLVQYHDDRMLYRSLMPLSGETLGRIVADQRFRRQRIESLDMPTLAHAMVGTRNTGSIRYHSTLTGVDEYAGYAPVAGHDWVVGVTESRARFEAPLRHLFDNVLYSVAVVGLVFLLLALWFARGIVRPVKRLTAAANALKEGDYERANIQVKVTADDEIGQLARTFNVMIDVLRQREREQRRGGLGRRRNQ